MHVCETCGIPATISVRDFAGPPESWEPAVAEHWYCRDHLRDPRYNVLPQHVLDELAALRRRVAELEVMARPQVRCWRVQRQLASICKEK